MDTARVAAGLATFIVGFTLLAACDSPATPSPQPAELNLTGTWSGAASDSTGPGSMTWSVTHTGSSVSGTLTMTDTATSKTGRGSVSGTLTSASLHFSIAIPAGSFESPYESCSSDVSGDAQASASSIVGTYSGTNSCTGIISSGQFTLTKSP